TAGEGGPAGGVVEPAAAHALRIRRAVDDKPEADDVRVDRERAVAAGAGRFGPLQRDVEFEPLAAQGKPHPTTGCCRDQVDRADAARGVPAHQAPSYQHAPRRGWLRGVAINRG